jgi:site-specific DNA-methyltransferase (adenine-specific)
MTILLGDCLDKMKEMEDNSIDFIVTDPPYGLHFMGKDWDQFKYKKTKGYNKPGEPRKTGVSETSSSFQAGEYDPKRDDEFQEFMRLFAIEAVRILKPGSHIAMFGSPRRHHRQMSGLEDAGFEIRDCLAWMFGQGFPKSHNFGRQMEGDWQKYGTALKPAYEPIILAMKPLDGTFAHNAEKWGVAGLNIDDCRIGTGQDKGDWPITERNNDTGIYSKIENKTTDKSKGRWPANLILSEEAAEELDQQTGNNISRFFYVAKASSSERNKGLEGMPLKSAFDNVNGSMGGNMGSKSRPRQNNHPTVKPITLMRYLLKLLAPPGNPIVLDPFAGSGSTLVAAKELGIRFIGIDKEPEYHAIAEARIKAVKQEDQLELPLT